MNGASSHALSPMQLNAQRQLMSFNWMVAARAHPDWLGVWVDPLASRGRTDRRLLQRISQALLERHGLMDRYLLDADQHPWLFWSPEPLQLMAQELGVAMLGGWVRDALEREQVLQQRRVLTADQRDMALRYANALRGLPFPADPGGWPVPLSGAASLFELGMSCLAALLQDEQGLDSDGTHGRFLMRFACGQIVPLVLTLDQREEARALVGQLSLQFAQAVSP